MMLPLFLVPPDFDDEDDLTDPSSSCQSVDLIYTFDPQCLQKNRLTGTPLAVSGSVYTVSRSFPWVIAKF
jgi:hypothetical protein